METLGWFEKNRTPVGYKDTYQFSGGAGFGLLVYVNGMINPTLKYGTNPVPDKLFN